MSVKIATATPAITPKAHMFVAAMVVTMSLWQLRHAMVSIS